MNEQIQGQQEPRARRAVVEVIDTLKIVDGFSDWWDRFSPTIQSIVVQLAERNIAPESTQNPSDQNAAYELSLMNSAVLQAIEKDCADVIGSIRQRLAQWVRESRREQFIATMTNLGWTHPGIAPQCGPEDQSIRSIGESLIPGHIDAGWTLEGRVGINRIIVLTKPGGPIRVIMPDGRTGDVVWE